MLQIDAEPGCTAVYGMSGTGKTVFSCRWLVARRDLTCRFIFQEPKRDIVQRFGLTDASNEDELACAVEDGFCIYWPGEMFPGNWKGAMDWFCAWSYRQAAQLPGRKLLMIDEVWKYCSPNSIPHSLNLWIQDGRSFGCETLFATQQPNRINEAIVGAATETVCFRLKGRNALKTVDGLGFDPDEVAQLPKGHFVSMGETGEERRGRLW